MQMNLSIPNDLTEQKKLQVQQAITEIMIDIGSKCGIPLKPEHVTVFFGRYADTNTYAAQVNAEAVFELKKYALE